MQDGFIFNSVRTNQYVVSCVVLLESNTSDHSMIISNLAAQPIVFNSYRVVIKKTLRFKFLLCRKDTVNKYLEKIYLKHFRKFIQSNFV